MSFVDEARLISTGDRSGGAGALGSKVEISERPEAYMLINAAWRRERSLPEKYIPEIKVAVEAAGLDWSKFQLTDNSCPLHPPTKAPLEELADDIQGVRSPL